MERTKSIISRLIVTAAIVVLFVPVAAAFSVTGQIQLIAPPVSILPNVLESDEFAFLFQERQRVTLDQDLFVDRLTGTGSAGRILAGTTVNSTFLHFDPVGIVGTRPDRVTFSGSIFFDTPILGLIWTGVACPDPCPPSAEYIDASDFLGAAGTQYPTNGLGRGLEADPYYDRNRARDVVVVGADNRSLTISASAFPRLSDQLRIITVALPEPGAVWLFIFGLAGIYFFARRGIVKMPVSAAIR